MNDAIGIRIERGCPDDTELAALIVALLLYAGAESEHRVLRPAPATWLRPERHTVFLSANSWLRAA
ncbi:acetyl-/propionyl-CoA carboxylase epsilon subunit [Nocardia nova SH22a]|uniref:Acetyl-/propionyl-CoA carboxylase epsilon subunit n=1 Tax=Nocardia nova SH22a TaxID=1415166 RepID=W5T9V4_9NOCA|nr:acyl-CoA carboxylase epsilon subunit [Nocardia nova]AHH15879.1 acetyl-/propionyl-CoA carboxylase epsilon subunit [Nocardia nova SH22a]